MQNENATIVTLAVFPFENLSEGKEMDIFSKSFCIELITELSRFRQFQIISYQSVKDLISDDKVVNESFSRLNTDYFIQGSFRIDNGLIRAKDAIEWAAKINPYRGETKLRPFWNYITEGKISLTKLEMPSTAAQNDLFNGFRKEGDLWKMSFSGATVQLAEVKGFADIQKLLSQPRRPVHCAELMGNVLSAQGEPLLDEKAKKSYQEKILEIQQEMEWAEERNDFKRLETLQESYDRLIDHLSRSLGLKGRIRQAGDPVEKARSAVTWRVRNAISKIEKAHPSLGKHLANSIKTGVFCTYDPEREVKWDVG